MRMLVGLGYNHNGTLREGELRTCRLSMGTVNVVETDRVDPAPVLVSRSVLEWRWNGTVMVTVTVTVGFGRNGQGSVSAGGVDATLVGLPRTCRFPFTPMVTVRVPLPSETVPGREEEELKDGVGDGVGGVVVGGKVLIMLVLLLSVELELV